MPNTADIAAQAGVRVKQLEWHRVGTREIAYALFGGSYAITEYAGMSKPYKLEKCGFDGSVSTYWDTRNEAKAAAQADYEARILAAIEPQAVAEPVAWAQMINGTVVQVTDSREKMQSWINAGYPDIRQLGFVVPVTTSDERAVEAEPALSIARAAANEMLAANTQWRLDPKYILTICDALEAALAAPPKAQPVQGWQTMDSAPKDEEVLIAYWRWRNSVSTGSIVVQSASQTQFHGDDIWSWVVSDNKHGPFPIRGWSDGDMIGWMPLPAGPSSKETAK